MRAEEMPLFTELSKRLIFAVIGMTVMSSGKRMVGAVVANCCGDIPRWALTRLLLSAS